MIAGFAIGHVWSAWLVRETLIKLDPLWKKSARWANAALVLGLLLPPTPLWFAIVVDLISSMYFQERKIKGRPFVPRDADLVAWAAANPAPVTPPPFVS